MQRKAMTRIWLALALLLASAVVWYRTATHDTWIEGHIYERRDMSGKPAGPVAAARVSTDRGDEHTITDGEGYFELRTRRVAPDEFVVVTVRTPDAVVTIRRLGKPRLSLDVVLTND